MKGKTSKLYELVPKVRMSQTNISVNEDDPFVIVCEFQTADRAIVSLKHNGYTIKEWHIPDR